MNKKALPVQDDEVIKLTVSEVKPDEPSAEKPISVPEEPDVSGSSSVVDDLYSEKAPEDNKDESVMLGSPVSIPKTAKSPKKGFLLFLGGLLLGGMVTGGIFSFIINPKKAADGPKVKEVVSIPTPEIEVTPEVTQAVPEADYSKYSVKVLNGSGVTGAAAKVEGLIKELSFKSVQTGNAAISNQKETTVQLKAGIPAAVFEKVGQLLVKYTVVEGDALEDSAGVDIQITVGIQKY